MGIDAVADFASLPLDANVSVTLDGNRTVGVLLDDRNAVSPQFLVSILDARNLTLATALDAPGHHHPRIPPTPSPPLLSAEPVDSINRTGKR